MAAAPKHRRSQAKQGRNRAHMQEAVKMPALVMLPSGIRVPSHMVTALNPIYRGIRFLATKRQKRQN